jgi:hypothetical protein
MDFTDFNQVYHVLKNNVATVTFTKVDGTQRNMRCTLKDDHLPEQYRGKGAVLTEAGNTMRVYDVDLGEWRSFRLSSITGINLNG